MGEDSIGSIRGCVVVSDTQGLDVFGLPCGKSSLQLPLPSRIESELITPGWDFVSFLYRITGQRRLNERKEAAREGEKGQ